MIQFDSHPGHHCFLLKLDVYRTVASDVPLVYLSLRKYEWVPTPGTIQELQTALPIYLVTATLAVRAGEIDGEKPSPRSTAAAV
jgi:hypothetical protein